MSFELYMGCNEPPRGVRLNIRRAARGVVELGDKLLMIGNRRGSYKFPGGGVKSGERVLDALVREIREESGYSGVLERSLLGTVYQTHPDTEEPGAYFSMQSIYYLCSAENAVIMKQELDGYEAADGFTPVVLTAEEALNANLCAIERGDAVIDDWLYREVAALRKYIRIKRGITSLYFVRHAQPEHTPDNRTRALTALGMADRLSVVECLANVDLDYALCSNFKRSVDTIFPCADAHGLSIYPDERLRERENAPGGNTMVQIEKRWSDFTFAETGGECLASVQKRNISALEDALNAHRGENVLIGTHGTALSTIMNHYDNNFLFKDFVRIMDFMPYVVRMDFKERELINKEELLIVQRDFRGK